VIGFEPNAAECARLNRDSGAARRYHPHAIGDGGPATFHVCAEPLTSSLLRPNEPLLKRYENLAPLCAVVEQVPMTTVRLDDIDEPGTVDLLKLDVQGASLLCLRGAQNLLASTLVVHAETEFVAIYTDEPLFSECELFLRERGFMFHHFHQTEGRRMLSGAFAVGKRASQQLWADAVFVPGFERLDALDTPDLVRLAWTMHTVYGACDMAMACLARCAGQTGLADRYRAHLAKHELLA
jgi:FkbM family methyltransferase